MAIVASFSFRGDKEIAAALLALPGTMRKQVIPGALRAAGRVVIPKARGLVPVETGLLKKSLGAVLRGGRRGRPQYLVIGPRTDIVGVGPDGRKRWPAKYAHLVELGHFQVQPVKGKTRRHGTAQAAASGKDFVPGRPFLGPAVNGSRDAIKAAFLRELAAGQVKAANRVRRR